MDEKHNNNGNATFANSTMQLAAGNNDGDYGNREEDSWDSRKVLRNLIVVSFAFFLLFTAFMGLSNLQSSINCDEGLGVASLATIYATLIFSALFMPSFVIKYIGIKWTLVAAMGCYTTYFVANFYPSWYTLIPASVLLGLGAAPMWSAQCSYLTSIGTRYAAIHQQTRDEVISNFFGIFFLFFQSSQVLGNLISSLVFSQGDDDPGDGNPGEPIQCGAMYCYTDDGSNNVNETSPCEESKPDAELVNIVIACYTACGIAAGLIILFGLNPIKPSKDNQTSSTKELVSATVRLMMQKRLILLIPITMYSGLEQAFLQGDFTKSYVTCAIGVRWVGYVLICYGVTDACSSLLSGRVEQYTGRIPQFALGALVHVSLVITMVVWEPNDEQLPVFFVLAAFWGLGDAIWQTQINAYYGVLFPLHQEPAFSNYRLWESAGYTMAFAYSNFLCTWVKLTILTSFLGLGMTGYFMTEFDRRDERDKQTTGDKNMALNGATNFGMEISSPDGQKLQVTQDMTSFKNNNI